VLAAEALEELRGGARSNLGSVASIDRKNRSSEARWIVGCWKIGWCRRGSLLMPNIPNTAPNAANNTMHSNVIGTVDCQAYGSLPDTQNG